MLEGRASKVNCLPGTYNHGKQTGESREAAGALDCDHIPQVRISLNFNNT
ncbi:hypothetical protein M7I_7571 [Glarea lozoyensis 74030]|uniref:Uncharacterized protein n=1 Tax=Glarea lozoyensis (strain ATCC 74030 / MF5533) TaxID=1104152 RepID=H0EXN2_GLAL7|nr:hypothetical protein M7I_7571 [Glarea lozoyensis 74030]